MPDINVLEIRQQHVPDLGCHDTETARTITHSANRPSWHNLVIVVSGVKGKVDDQYTYITDNTLAIDHGYSRVSSACF